MNPKRKVGEKCNVYCEYQKNGICHTYGDAYKLCEKRKVGKSCLRCRFNHENYCSIVDIKDWHCSQRNGFKYFEPQPEVKNCENCENCFYQGTDGHKADTRLPCLDCCLADDHNKHLEWKPRQEEIEVTIGFINEGNYDFEVMCSDNDRLRELIPKGSTRKFKLIKVEERVR